jgi:pimeloyl-ACP methyl ester carboxylesterase
MNTILVLLPGIAGSGLKSAAHPLAWPIEVLTLASTGHEPAASQLLKDGSLEPGEPILWSPLPGPLPFNFEYGKFRHFFEELGFTPVVCTVNHLNLPQDRPERLVVGFAYDWRQNNAVGGLTEGSADDLRQLLSAIHAAYEGTAYEIFLVGHSMGGLVARAYLENVASQGDLWYRNIAGLITLGTPHLGAPLAVDAITGKLAKFFLPYATLIHDFTKGSSSVYELLPPPLKQFITVDAVGYSIFDDAFKNTPAWTWLLDQGLSEANLEAAKHFFEGLNYSGAEDLPPYYCIYGHSCLPVTRESFTFNATTKKLDGTSDAMGDAIVPQWSASFAGRTVAGLYRAEGVNHLELPGNTAVLAQVATWTGVVPAVVHFTEIAAPAGARA